MQVRKEPSADWQDSNYKDMKQLPTELARALKYSVTLKAPPQCSVNANRPISDKYLQFSAPLIKYYNGRQLLANSTNDICEYPPFNSELLKVGSFIADAD